MAGAISLKVLVDKKKNRVIYAESDEDFVDVLFSFLTTPIGTIIRLTSNESPTLRMGSLNNLYKSVDNIGVQYFRSQGRKSMLLSPRNWAEPQCKKLKVNIDGDAEATKHYLCHTCDCSHMLVCHYEDAICNCGTPMNREKNLSEKESKDHGGVFVKGLTRFIISDDLQVMPVSTMASISLFSKHGIADGSTIEEITFCIARKDEVLNLLGRALISRMPLTEALLKHKPLAELNSVNILYEGGSCVDSQTNEDTTDQETKITVKLMVSKSKNMVCYAEVKKDFVDLLFSFLAVPLGYMVNNMRSGSLNGCIDQLYKSVQDLDEECFNSSEQKEMLVSPKLAFGFGYKNDLVGVEEGSQPTYYYRYGPGPTGYEEILSTCASICYPASHYPHGYTPITLTIIDPKYREFLTGPTMFVVTDNLIIAPISSIFSLSILNQLKIPFSDIEEKVVHVGKEEALRLLMSSLGSESALTNSFIRKPKQEPQ